MDMPAITAPIEPEQRPAPVRAILCVVGSLGDDSEGRLELRPWPMDAASSRS